MREQKSILQGIDWMLVGLYLTLVFMGWINIYAAVYNEEHKSILDMTQNYGKQLIWIVSSIFIAVIILIIDGKFYAAFSYPIYGVTIILLLLVLVLGHEVAGAKAWFEIGSVRIQPAEFAKFATNLAIAKYLSTLNIRIEDMKTKIITGAILALPALLILAQNDTGSAMTYAAFVFVLYREGLSGNFLWVGLLIAVLFVSSLAFEKTVVVTSLAVVAFLFYLSVRKKMRNIMIIIGCFLATTAFVYGVDYVFDKILLPHQRERIDVLLGKEIDLKGAGYNVNQSKIAIGSGGFWGKGFLQGTQTKYDFVPEQSTDFIFCTVGEEWGFLGSMIVVALLVTLMLRVIFVAERQRSTFSRIYGYGVASILFIHFAINIGMALGIFPVIGIPLPFFSYGGSSLWGFTILLAILIKLDAYRFQILR